MFPWATDIFKFSMYIQGPTIIIFVKFSKPYIYSRPYVYSFCQIFKALQLFSALHLFRTLDYSCYLLLHICILCKYIMHFIKPNGSLVVRLLLKAGLLYGVIGRPQAINMMELG